MNGFKRRLGGKIREKRKLLGITQEDLAECVNVSPAMIGQIERGRTMPSVETLCALIRHLGLDPRVIFTDAPQADSDYMELCLMAEQMTSAQRKLLLSIARTILRDMR